MEVAVTVVLGAGIKAVLACSFSRTYFRNAVNNGLLPLICDTTRIHEGDRLAITNENGLMIRNETTGETSSPAPVPKIMMEILACGGLVPYFRRYRDFRI
jgi:3-isopropylmalate/(R)-2-methylmalate dehydratase small subunit